MLTILSIRKIIEGSAALHAELLVFAIWWQQLSLLGSWNMIFLCLLFRLDLFEEVVSESWTDSCVTIETSSNQIRIIRGIRRASRNYLAAATGLWTSAIEWSTPITATNLMLFMDQFFKHIFTLVLIRSFRSAWIWIFIVHAVVWIWLFACELGQSATVMTETTFWLIKGLRRNSKLQ